MLDEQELRARLPLAGLGSPMEFYATIGSTNERALQLAAEGAPHGTLVLSDEQTAGRGRLGRRWSTPAGCALAFSLVLRPSGAEPFAQPESLAVFGALAVVEVLSDLGAQASIKWPNDVLLEGQKAGGVLAEVAWSADRLLYVVLGIGLNVRAGAIPNPEILDFPATDVERILGRQVERSALLLGVLERLGHWWASLGSAAMRQAWHQHLAYLGQQVELLERGEKRTGILQGLSSEGRLIISTENGVLVVGIGAESLRPVDKASD